MLALDNAPEVHYTQDATDRWDGIANRRNSFRGKFPINADCSSFVTWCLWNALFSHFRLDDTVNGADWKAGFTGTLRDHGKLVKQKRNICRGDLVHYDPVPPDFNFEHVSIIVGRNEAGEPMVVSHGSESGPFFVEHDYRPVAEIRRYI
jgi:cell wall-associated NlpC family hydrolase